MRGELFSGKKCRLTLVRQTPIRSVSRKEYSKMLGWLKAAAARKAVSAMRDDLERFIAILKGCTSDEVATHIVLAQAQRLELSNDGLLPRNSLDIGLYQAGTNIDIDMVSFNLGLYIRRKQAEQSPNEASATFLWLHSVRSIQNPELRLLGRQMWAEISRGYPALPQVLDDMASHGFSFPLDFDRELVFVPRGLEPNIT